MKFEPAIDEQMFALEALAGELFLLGRSDTVALSLCDARAVLDEASRFATEVLLPLRRPSDRQGCRMGAEGVRTPDGVRSAYHRFADGGWVGARFPQAVGGQQLPNAMSVCLDEIWNACGIAFALCPMLTQSAVEALLRFGSPVQRSQFLGPLVNGRWTGTMNLTEPQAGSDLSAIKCRAIGQDDGTYRVFGQKIFVTYGDHDLTTNIIHMVLARTPDAPPGTKGISMFIVPKLLQATDGSWTVPNDVRCVALEHKLGIHGSPTCTMAFGDAGGAVAHLVGELHAGLSYMFSMMNHARFSVGLEGLGVASAAQQMAFAFARERVQGRVTSQALKGISGHPDVKRMLLEMEAHVVAMRGLCIAAGACMDQAGDAQEARLRDHSRSLVDLLTPLVKGWCTEVAQQVTHSALQVHGGMGFIEETGIAQLVRDARITTIYEGTTGIQANDFLFRKLLGKQACGAASLVTEMEATSSVLGSETLGGAALATNFAEVVATCRAALSWLAEAECRPEPQLRASAVTFLTLFGYAASSWAVARMAVFALRRLRTAQSSPLDLRRIAVFHIYLELAAARTAAALREAIHLSSAITAFPDESLYPP